MSKQSVPGQHRPTPRHLALVAALAIGAAGAQDLELQQAVIVPGGNSASGGDFELDSTLGQPVAGVSAGGDFVLESGFHGQEGSGEIIVPPAPELVFASGFES